MGFPYFPPELLEAICDNLDWTDVCSLRLACKRLAESLAQVVCRRVKLDLSPDNEAAGIRKLQMLVDGEQPQATRGARILVVILREGFHIQGRHMSTGKLLSLAIPTLRGVHTVDLGMGGADAASEHLLLDAILTLPNVRHVTLTTPERGYYQHSIALGISPILPTLRSLHIHYVRPSGGREEIISHLSKAIANAPHLSSLTVTLQPSYRAELSSATSLHTLFGALARGQRPPLKLTALNLSGFSIRLDDETLPHLRHLRSLTLAHFQDPSSLRTEAYEAVAKFAAPFPDLWRGFMSVGVQLTHINVRHMSDGLAEYVNSYCGLEDIKIYVPSYYRHGRIIYQPANIFWDAMAGKHGETLRSLDLISQYEGCWCFNAATLAKCRNLVVLRIGIGTSRFNYPPFQKRASDFLNQSCHEVRYQINLLDVVAWNMPKLDQLTICARTGAPGDHPTTGMIDHTGALIVMNKAVREYSAPVFCGHLPDLEIEVYERRTIWKSSLRRAAKPGPYFTTSLMKDAIRYTKVLLLKRSRMDARLVRQLPLAYHRLGEDDDFSDSEVPILNSNS